MIIEIYSKDNCPHCVTAKRVAQSFAQETTHTIIEYNMSQDEQYREKLLTEIPQARSVPQCFVDGAHIGGADQLIEFIKQQKQNTLLG